MGLLAQERAVDSKSYLWFWWHERSIGTGNIE